MRCRGIMTAWAQIKPLDPDEDVLIQGRLYASNPDNVEVRIWTRASALEGGHDLESLMRDSDDHAGWFCVGCRPARYWLASFKSYEIAICARACEHHDRTMRQCQ